MHPLLEDIVRYCRPWPCTILYTQFALLPSPGYQEVLDHYNPPIQASEAHHLDDC
jgi:hypothetical protein